MTGAFTTRPEIQGTFGVCTSTHWIASAVGMRMLEAGGTAADAAVAMGFTLTVVEPHLNGPLGDLVGMLWEPGAEAPKVLCGQGVAPAGATIAHYRAEGLEFVPGSGLLATVVPGAFDAWMLMLRDHGRLSLRDVLEPAIHYARAGHPLLPRVSDVIRSLAPYFESDWPTSFATWVPGGKVPDPGALFANPALADTWERLLTEAETASGREAQIEAARRIHREGFIAEAVDDWMREACVTDATGERRKGVLTGADMAGWQASWEAPLSLDTRGWRVFKAGFWCQGPVQLQALALLEDAPDDPAGFVHHVTEALKLAMADREAYCGDTPGGLRQADLLDPAYARDRRGLIGETASHDQRPGRLPGYELLADAAISRAAASEQGSGAGAGEPTMAHLSARRGDTVHLDVIDRWGLSISVTPSGGWLQSSPAVPALGMALNSRAQMFWLEEGLPSSLTPGKRPRTTLTPSMALSPGGTRLAYGTPGGDQQDQWQTILILRLMMGMENLQEAIDAPLFHTGHAQGSFQPRVARPGHLMVEPALGAEVIADLEARGHRVEVAEPWSVGRLTAASRSADGILKAAATPRLMQAYAVGR